MDFYPSHLPPRPGIAIDDAHTHNLEAGPSAIINLPAGICQPPRADRWYSIGLHPWDTANCTGAAADQIMDEIAAAARNERVLAIGECGLDSLRGADMKEQERIFLRHIRISEELQKPLIVHAVRTLHRIVQLRKATGAQQPWIMHGFRGNAAKAQMLLDAGIDISIGSKHMPEIEAIVPAERLWHETDTES